MENFLIPKALKEHWP